MPVSCGSVHAFWVSQARDAECRKAVHVKFRSSKSQMLLARIGAWLPAVPKRSKSIGLEAPAALLATAKDSCRLLCQTVPTSRARLEAVPRYEPDHKKPVRMRLSTGFSAVSRSSPLIWTPLRHAASLPIVVDSSPALVYPHTP